MNRRNKFTTKTSSVPIFAVRIGFSVVEGKDSRRTLWTRILRPDEGYMLRGGRQNSWW